VTVVLTGLVLASSITVGTAGAAPPPPPGAVGETSAERVVTARAALACEPGRVLAYVPAYTPAPYTRSNLAYTRLYVWAALYRYSFVTKQWLPVVGSGWWAYATTNANGYPAVVGPFGAIWLATATNAIARFRPFAATRGYYAVRTYLYDAGDRTTVYVWNITNVSNPSSSTICLVP
jgi:hypothetical protein